MHAHCTACRAHPPEDILQGAQSVLLFVASQSELSLLTYRVLDPRRCPKETPAEDEVQPARNLEIREIWLWTPEKCHLFMFF